LQHVHLKVLVSAAELDFMLSRTQLIEPE